MLKSIAIGGAKTRREKNEEIQLELMFCLLPKQVNKGFALFLFLKSRKILDSTDDLGISG
jgi:hypothetical protein